MTVNCPDVEFEEETLETSAQNRRRVDWETTATVTQAKVRKAIWSFDPYNAAGPNDITLALQHQNLMFTISV